MLLFYDDHKIYFILHVCLKTHMYQQIYICIWICTCIWMSICMYVCLFVFACVCMCLCIWVCVCVHVYVHSSIKDLINNYQQFIRNADIEAPTLLQTGTTNTIYIYISCLKHSLCNIYWVNEAFLYSFIIWNAFFVVIHRTYIYFTCMIIVFMWLVNLLKKRWTYSNMKL